MTWKLKLSRDVVFDLWILPSGPRNEAIDLLNRLAVAPSCYLTAPLTGRTNRYKLNFFGDRYRMIVNVRGQSVIVYLLRLRRRYGRTDLRPRSTRKARSLMPYAGLRRRTPAAVS